MPNKKTNKQKNVTDFTEIKNEIIGRRRCFGTIIGRSVFPRLFPSQRFRVLFFTFRRIAEKIVRALFARLVWNVYALVFWEKQKNSHSFFPFVAYDRNPVRRERTEICGQVLARRRINGLRFELTTFTGQKEKKKKQHENLRVPHNRTRTTGQKLNRGRYRSLSCRLIKLEWRSVMTTGHQYNARTIHRTAETCRSGGLAVLNHKRIVGSEGRRVPGHTGGEVQIVHHKLFEGSPLVPLNGSPADN